jgi:ribosomal protein S18 acetylase RimI-like enzyme
MVREVVPAQVRVRPMTAAEFDAFRGPLIIGYAADHVGAGNWTADEAEQKATAELAELLPAGVDTPGVLLLIGESLAGERVGHLWLAINEPHRSGTRAYIYDIEVDSEQRGKGYGRALLNAAETEAVRHGATAIALNVFGANQVARGLYESAGYEIATIGMRKPLGGS